MSKKQALIKYLDQETTFKDEVVKGIIEKYDNEKEILFEDQELLILTDEEAEAYVYDAIEGSLWTFNPFIIASHVKSDFRVDNYDLIESIKKAQECCGDDLNPMIKAMIIDIDDFIFGVVSSNGRGHYLSYYDGKEHEYKILDESIYIYRRG